MFNTPYVYHKDDGMAQTCVFDAVSEPSCSLKTSLPGNWAHVSDSIEINCTVEYWGSWKPNVSCVPEAPARVIEGLDYDNYNKTFRRVSYVRVVAAADIADRAVIICHTTFFRPASEKPPKLIDTIPEGPQYHHTWTSSPIHVFNTTGSTHLLRQVSVRNVSTRSSYVHVCSPVNGSLAEGLACWNQAQKGLGSNRSRDAVG